MGRDGLRTVAAALPALADEPEEDACWEVQTPGDASGAWRLKDACDRIRGALGVEPWQTTATTCKHPCARTRRRGKAYRSRAGAERQGRAIRAAQVRRKRRKKWA